jgi:hypothetical protein
MKIAIGYRLQSGPWGGGNRFVIALSEALEHAGYSVVFDLTDSDIDIILLMDPRAHRPLFSFGAGAILRYLACRNSSAMVVHRINECDERKNTRHMNKLLTRANYCADHTVFVGSWLRDLPAWRTAPLGESSVILNGADTGIFNARGFMPWTGAEPMKLVTHHWGGNRMKGFDIYERIDNMLADESWKERIRFTYVGNLPKGFRFHHARHVAPLTGEALADELRSHHAYITASINEPGGNHQNEGALCGLPLLYRESGCLPEYCAGFGVPFGPESFETALNCLMSDYNTLAGRMNAYPHTAERMTANWLGLFETLFSRRKDYAKQRNLFRSPWLFTRNQIAI